MWGRKSYPRRSALSSKGQLAIRRQIDENETYVELPVGPCRSSLRSGDKKRSAIWVEDRGPLAGNKPPRLAAKSLKLGDYTILS